MYIYDFFPYSATHLRGNGSSVALGSAHANKLLTSMH